MRKGLRKRTREAEGPPGEWPDARFKKEQGGKYQTLLRGPGTALLRRAQGLARIWSQVRTGWWGGQGRGQEVYIFLFLKKVLIYLAVLGLITA